MKKLLSLLTLLVVAISTSWGAITPKVIADSDGEVYMVTQANMYSYYDSGNGWATNGSGGAISSNTYFGAKTGGNNTNYINPETEESGTKGQATGITLKTADNRSARFYFTGAVKATAFIAVTGSSRTATITVYKVSDDTSVGSTTSESYSASGAYDKLEVSGLDASETYYAKVTATNDLCLYAMKFFATATTEAYTVTFNAGTNGTCATTSLTEEAAGAGVTLPAATPNEGYTFDGWYNGETNVGDAGATYKPKANITLTAHYSELTAPSIEVNSTSVSTYAGVAVTFTATADGAPDPTVTWYSNTSASTTGGTSVGTGLTYQPDVTTEGIYYYYAVASNGVEPDATSEVITLTVTDPNKYITGNAYYMSEGEVAVAGENVYADDITMTIKDYKGGAATADNYVTGINSNYVAQISGTQNGWGTEFVATKDGTLSVGVIINGSKTFTLTNVTSFDYNGVQDEGSNVTSESAGTNPSNTWTPAKKQWTVLTFDVVAGTTYKLSVAGSKMGFYGFEFIPEGTVETISIPEEGVLTYVTQNALDFSTQNGAFKAYAVTNVGETSATTAEVGQVPAGTPLLIKGAAGDYDVEVIASASAIENLLLASDGNVTGGDNIYAYSKTALKFKKVASTVTIPAGKCYLQATGGDALDIIFDGEATAIGNVNANDNANFAPVKVLTAKGVQIGKFNVAGQQVK